MAPCFAPYHSALQFVYDASNPGQAACRAAPVLVFLGVTAFSLSSLVTGGPLIWPILQSLAAGTIGAVIVSATIDRQLGEFLGDFCEIPGKVQVRRVTPKGPTGTQLKIVYVVFGYLQVSRCCAVFLKFLVHSHGLQSSTTALQCVVSDLFRFEVVLLQYSTALRIAMQCCLNCVLPERCSNDI